MKQLTAPQTSPATRRGSAVWLPVALSLGAVAFLALNLGWTQIIASVTGPYGHTITDGSTGYTITGTTSGTFSGTFAGISTNADSLQHKFPDFGVDLLADSLAVKAPLASPTFTGLTTVDSMRGPGKVLNLGGDTLKWMHYTGSVADRILFTKNTSGNPTITFQDSTAAQARDYADLCVLRGTPGTGIGFSRALFYLASDGSSNGMILQGNKSIWMPGDTLGLAGSIVSKYAVLLGYNASGSTTKGTIADSTGLYAQVGLSVGGGTMMNKIYMQNDSLYIDLSTGAKLQMKPIIIGP